MVATVMGIFSFSIFVAIATKRKVRRNPFNLYLLYLAVPDFIFSLSCGVTCLLNALNQEYWSSWMCSFQQWYMVFGIGANAWLNACITRELYIMMRRGDRRKRYIVPTRRYVTKQAIGCYLFMGTLASLGIIDSPNWPIHTGATSGLYCLPMEVDKPSSIFFWLAWFPLFAAIPSAYIIFVTCDIWRRKLLPPSGRRRLLAIYFGRLILVFYLFWLPTLLVMFAFTSFVSPTLHYIAGLWSHLQGGVSALLCLLKPDIFEAVKRLYSCPRRRRSKKSSESPDDFVGIQIITASSTNVIEHGDISSTGCFESTVAESQTEDIVKSNRTDCENPENTPVYLSEEQGECDQWQGEMYVEAGDHHSGDSVDEDASAKSELFWPKSAIRIQPPARSNGVPTTSITTLEAHDGQSAVVAADLESSTKSILLWPIDESSAEAHALEELSVLSSVKTRRQA